MDKLLLRARVEEIIDTYELSEEIKEELTDSLVTEFTKLELEEGFDAELEERDELDEG